MQLAAFCVVFLHISFYNSLKLLRDIVALQRHCFLTVYKHWRHWRFTGAR